MKLIKFSIIIFELHSENRPSRVNRVKVRGNISKQNGSV
jgi:hypothetical protein